MRKSINANSNVIRSEIRRNRVEAIALRGVDVLRASGPAEMHQHDAYHRVVDGPVVGPRGGSILLQDQRSSLHTSSAWQGLSKPISRGQSSQKFTGPCFTATCTATTALPQAAGRLERRAGLAAARALASA